MKAGSGILHDERPTAEFVQRGGELHGLQLWINLPKSHKEDVPDYFNLPADQVPVHHFSDGSVARVLIGQLENAVSPVPAYSPMAVWHIKLSPGTHLDIPILESWNAFIYVPTSGIQTSADSLLTAGQMAVYDKSGDQIHLHNPNTDATDLILFAGAPIGEPIYTSGPFVMADLDGIHRAYDDYHAGKYKNLEWEWE